MISTDASRTQTTDSEPQTLNGRHNITCLNFACRTGFSLQASKRVIHTLLIQPPSPVFKKYVSPLSQNPPISILLFQNVPSSSSILLIDPTPNLLTLDNRLFLTMSGGRGCFNCGGCAWCFLCCFVDIYSIQRPKSCCSQSVTDLGGSPYARRKLAFTFCLPTFFFLYTSVRC